MSNETIKEVEPGRIDTRFEGLRLKDKNREKALLSSILEHGIEEPLQCAGEGFVLLDGFKRLRAAKNLGLKLVPVALLGENEPAGILRFIKLSNVRSLDMLEQAALVDELNRSYGMSPVEISRHVERSPAWVSVRLGVIGRMSAEVRKAVFAGKFPVRSYMYTLRPFTRVKKKETEKFVKAVSGKGLSTRAIETLANGYFKGSAELKEQILEGNVDWTLRQMNRDAGESLNEFELRALKDLKLAEGCIRRIPYKIADERLKTGAFLEAARPVILTILKRLRFFRETLEEFHGYTGGEEKNGKDAV
jgi:hypothetical protein